MILTRVQLGLVLRTVCIRQHKKFSKAAEALGVRPDWLVTAWSRNPKDMMRMDSIITLLDKLGYNLYFEIKLKGQTQHVYREQAGTGTERSL